MSGATDFVERLARKWCPRHYDEEEAPPSRVCVCYQIAAAIREALDDSSADEKAALMFETGQEVKEAALLAATVKPGLIGGDPMRPDQ